MKNKFFKTYGSALILLISVIAGSILGLIIKEDALVLKPFGDIFLNLMFTIIVPLVFFTITSSISKMVNIKRLGKILKSTFIIFIITSFIASSIMLISIKFIDITSNTNIKLEASENIENINLGDRIVDMLTVNDFAELFTKDNMLPLIIFSIIFGLAITKLENKNKDITKLLDMMSQVMMKVTKLIMLYAPIGLFAYFAALTGEFGYNLLASYAKSILLYYGIAVLYYIIIYTLYSYIAEKKKGIKKFYKNILPITVTSLATQSSLASLPTNLDTAKNLDIEDDVAGVVMPIGSTMHMEGSAMASILKIAFLFGIFNQSFIGIDTYLIALLVAVLSGIVMSGIPGGGLIGEMLIVSLYGFPLTAFPIIATIGILVDPPATCLNVVGDTTSSLLINKVVGKEKNIRKKINM